MPTTNQNSDISQEPSQTALILEHVEMLLSLHGDMQGDKHSELNDLIDSLEQSLDSKTAERCEKLDQRITAISESSIDQLTRQFNEKTETMVNSFQSQITELLDNLGDRFAKISTGTDGVQEGNVVAAVDHVNPVDPAEPVNPVDPAERVDPGKEAAKHWAEKKAAMLSKYGIDPEHRPVREFANGEGAAETGDLPTRADAESVIGQPLESLHQSIDNISEADAEKIEQLKAELTSKLRDAEVELAVNRAKLSQQQAELESDKVELERRTSAIEKKYAAAQQSPAKKTGFVDRLTRHLRKNDKPKPDTKSD